MAPLGRPDGVYRVVAMGASAHLDGHTLRTVDGQQVQLPSRYFHVATHNLHAVVG